MSTDYPVFIYVIGIVFFVFVAARVWTAWRDTKVKNIDEDRTDIFSPSLRLVGRPYRVERLRSGAIVPTRKINRDNFQDNIRIQLGAYMLLVEEKYGKRPPFGFVITRRNKRVKVMNSPKLRRQVKSAIAGLLKQREDLYASASGVRPRREKCRKCSMRNSCQRKRV